MPRKLTTKEFIDSCKEIHGSKFGYEKVTEVTYYSMIEIYCKCCKEYFTQRAGDHKRGNGHMKCSSKKRGLTRRGVTLVKSKEFIVRLKERDAVRRFKETKKIKSKYKLYAFPEGYKYDRDKKVKVICKNCGKNLRDLPLKIHCTCAKNKGNTYKFILRAKQIHGSLYGYHRVRYINAHTKVEIYCRYCKQYFLTTPNNHLTGFKCNKCNLKEESSGRKFSRKGCEVVAEISKLSKLKFIHAMNGYEEVIKTRDKRYSVDGYNKRYKICIEYNGSKWHGNPRVFHPEEKILKIKAKDRYESTIKKRTRLTALGYTVITIWDTQWKKDKDKVLESVLKRINKLRGK